MTDPNIRTGFAISILGTSDTSSPQQGHGEVAPEQVKGPWRIERHRSNWLVLRDGACIPMSRKTRELAQEACDFENRMHAEKLVKDAAADMLAVLRQIVEAVDSGNLQMSSPELGEPESGIPMHQWHEEMLHYARAAIAKATGAK